MTGSVTLPCCGVALDDCAGSAGFDNGATTDAIAHTSDGLAIHECCICAGFHSAFAMERAAMTMAYQYDGFHLRFLLPG